MIVTAYGEADAYSVYALDASVYSPCAGILSFLPHLHGYSFLEVLDFSPIIQIFSYVNECIPSDLYYFKSHQHPLAPRRLTSPFFPPFFSSKTLHIPFLLISFLFHPVFLQYIKNIKQKDRMSRPMATVLTTHMVSLQLQVLPSLLYVEYYFCIEILRFFFLIFLPYFQISIW